MAVANRCSVLDAMQVAFAGTERVRFESEPPREVTAAYVSLLFACGFARLGEVERARELQRGAHVTLDPLRPDPVHAWLVAACDAVLAGAAPPLATLDELDRVARYKVDRFREVSRLVGEDEPMAGEPRVDAMLRFARQRWPDPEWIAGSVEDARSTMAMAGSEDQDWFDACVKHVLRRNVHLPVAMANEILELGLAHAEAVSAECRAEIYALAALAAKHAAPDRCRELAERVLPLLDASPGFLVEDVVRTLSTLEPDVLAAIWPRLPLTAREPDAYMIGLLRLGDSRGLDWYRSTDASGEQVRAAIFDHYLARPFETRFDEPWAVELYRRTTDAYATNSHFTVSVVEVVDRVVRAIVDG